MTLELGGNNPCVIDKSASLNIAAKRIVWGKFLNCGQTCIAPNYLAVHSDIKEEFLAKLINQVKESFKKTLSASIQ